MGGASSFGEQLRRFRELAGLSQEELADRAKLTSQAIGMLERGERRSPYPHTVRALADGLGLDAAGRAALIAALPQRSRRDRSEVGVASPPPAASATSIAIAPAAVAADPPTAAPRWEPRSWFPQTKLRPPRVGEATLPRPHLLAQARSAILGHRLTLASAPAGSGKTTLLAALTGALPDLPVAWLALDADDNDPATFAAALALALRAALPGLGAATEALLDSLPEPGAQLRRLMGTLINDLAAASAGPFVLVLDDLHAIGDPTIHAALDHLIERLPDDAHVVVAARYDPPLALARLRARGQLAELRLAELRFTPAETGALLNDRLALALADGEVLRLHDRVGGWAAGLRLLALMLGRLPTAEERRDFVARLREDGRYLFDFLAEEVLGQQEPELQRFLLDAAILPELTPALCRAVTGRDDAAQLLDQAYRRNLFLTLGGGPVAETGTTYRFHDLFAEFLRGRLALDPPERARELHRRAAEAATEPPRAIAHFSAAGCWDDAARVIEERGADLARHGLYRRLRDWIVGLPEEIREARPRLLLLLGTYAFHAGDWEAAQALLERAWHGLTAQGDHATAIEAAMPLINMISRTGDEEKGNAWVLRATEHGPIPIRFQLFLAFGRAWAGIRTGDFAATTAAVSQSAALLLSSNDLSAWEMSVINPPLAAGPDGPAALEACCLAALPRLGDGPSVARVNVEAMLGYIELLRGRLDAAADAAERATALSELLGGVAESGAILDHVHYAIALLRDGPDGAVAYLTARWPQIEANTLLRTFRGGYRYMLAKAHWLAGRPEDAQEAGGALAAKGVSVDPQARSLIAGMLATSAGHYDEAERHLRAAIAFRPSYYSIVSWFDHPQVLLAHALERSDRPREALAELRPVLAECERLDTPGIILKVGPAIVAPLLRHAVEHGIHAPFAARLLGLLGAGTAAATPAADGIPVPDTGEILSPREVEVLRQLAAGASNATIADALFISHNTVKTHVARVLAKLGVASRTAAAARARALGIG